MSMILDGTNGATFNDGSLQAAAASPYVLKNRIINGAMVIDQRNAGASVTQLASVVYGVDRWYTFGTVTSKFTAQRNAGSVTPPAGFSNYWGITSSSAYTPGTSEQFIIVQGIEGYNIADLNLGTANAKTVTLSFWVRSSLTGTFAGGVQNGAANRSYSFSYSIPTANTWTQISVTIPGDTTGTWDTTNGTGMLVNFSMGTGSTFQSTVNTWSAGNFKNVSGAVNVVGTNGATFYITGVQLEIGTSATPFERRLYGTELALCQRYYNRWSGENFTYGGLTTCLASGGTTPSARRAGWFNPVDFRAQPTLGYGGTIQLYTAALTNIGFTGFTANFSNKNIVSFDINSSSAGTAGQGLMLILDSSSAANYIDASAEL